MTEDPAGGGAAIVVTGAGACSPFGSGWDVLLQGLRRGVPVATPLPGDARGGAGLAAAVGHEIEPGPFHPNGWRRLDRCSRMAALAVAEGLAAAGIAAGEGAAGNGVDIALAIGTATSGIDPLNAFLALYFKEGPLAVSPSLFPFSVPNAPAAQASILLGLRGPAVTVCRMEASGLGAVAAGARLLEDVSVRAVVAGGVDEVPPVLAQAWRRWRTTRREVPERGGLAVDPTRRGEPGAGFLPGEGAYMVVLERLADARRRGAVPWAVLAGVAEGHAPGRAHTWPQQASAPVRVMHRALETAGLAARQLGCLFASRNGARAHDRIEEEALEEVLRSAPVPITSVKGTIGESGAAGACAFAAAAAAVRDGIVPPAAAWLRQPPAPRGLVAGEPLRRSVPAALVNAWGTGGACVSAVLRTVPREEAG